MNVYLDNASTTGVSKEVLEAMLPYFQDDFGNPSSLHDKGIQVRKVINQSRSTIADLLHCDKSEIYFTSGGTESINWAIKGIAFQDTEKYEIITTPIEHHATLNTCEFLEKMGYVITYAQVDEKGFIDLDNLASLINPGTLLVSVIMANNEIGTIQNIEEISKLCQTYNTYLHVDAVQAVSHIEIDLRKLNVDLLSISGHKFHAPKGIGVLYIKNGTNIQNLIHGGQQELNHRAGTENVPYIVGITKAMEIGIKKIDMYNERLYNYSQVLLAELDDAGIKYHLNGPEIGVHRLPGNLNLSFKGIDGPVLTYLLNKRGIYVSNGSACDSKSIEVSHVIKAINVNPDYINSTIRISIGSETTLEQITYATRVIIDTIKEQLN
ncbi:MAG: cysteine desulfurase [Bacilli bacterium]|nr:cysteine desulfurase [Bacilli bacterium]